MSVRLQILIDKHIDRRDIEEILFSLGYQKEEEYENTYFWYNDDFVSLRGCWFHFYHNSEVWFEDEEKNFKTVCDTSTSAGRSYHDYQMQIDTIKKIEEAFGGVVYTDGEYGYFENDLPNLSRTEIACGYAYITFERNLEMVEPLIEEVDSTHLRRYQELGILPLGEKGFLRNNILIPFFVSIMESFLKEFLDYYLRTNKEAENLIFKKKDKLPYSVVKELLNGEKTIIDVEMESYSFQNFSSANKAYSHFIKIDLFKDILTTRMYFNDQEYTLISILSELLETRHTLIHEAILDYSLNKEQMEKYHKSLVLLKNTFKTLFKEKKNLRIDLDNQI
ncbi:hypothetical protein [Fictibacillus sp. NRS-1165]|uniref:hypothetical protein n=1 Tax=Fictibacillus sp. NRS-1165 TaxID=3144463 RepID=UPI003D21ED2C